MKAITTTLEQKVNPRFRDDYNLELLQDHEILVKTLRVGICGTDIDVMKGFYGGMPQNSSYLVLGHECVGEIEKLGKSVKDFEVGDIVVPSIRFSKCHCNSCSVGRYDYCYTGQFKEKGIDIHGFGSEYFKHEPSHLLKIDNALIDRAVLTEPMAVAEKIYEVFEHSLNRLPNPKGGPILVIGAGAIGQLTSRLFKLKGFNVIVASLESEKSKAAQLVRSADIEYINIKNMRDSLKGKCFSGIMECAGNGFCVLEPLLNDILALNGTLVSSGIPNKKLPMEVDANQFMSKLVIGNRDIIGVINQSLQPHFQNAIKDLGNFNRAEDIITHRFKPEECEKAFNTFLNDPERIKIIFEFEQNRCASPTT